MTVRNPLIWRQGYLSELPSGDIVQFSVGAAGTPSITFRSNNGYGFFYSSSQVCVSVAGSLSGAFSATGYVQSYAGGGASALTVSGEGAVGLILSRYSANTSPPVTALQKARGTIASPAVPAIGDTLGEWDASGYNGAGGFTVGASFRAVLTESGTVGTNMGTQAQIWVTPIGSGTQTEVATFDNEAGFSMFGANPVIDQNRLVLLRNYVVAALPASPPDGAMAFATDCMLTAITGLGLAPTGGGTNKVPVYAAGGGWLML